MGSPMSLLAKVTITESSPFINTFKLDILDLPGTETPVFVLP